MEKSEDSIPLEPAGPKRRRRRTSAPVEPVSPAAEVRAFHTAPEETKERAHPSLWQQWALRASSFGLTSAFRAYLFVGSIIAILVYFLYTESLIKEFREDERGRAALYATLYSFALSPLATSEQTALIFREVITKDRGDFPFIFTNHQGEITHWKGTGLPDVGDTSKAAMLMLGDLVEKMDAQKDPIPFELSLQSRGLLHYDSVNFVLSDSEDEIAGWRGRDLPAEGDTTAAAREKVRQAMLRMDVLNEPHPFYVASESFSHLLSDGANFVIADSEGEIVEWWGPALPAQGDRTPAALAQVEELMLNMGIETDPYTFKISSGTRQYIHYGDSMLVSRLAWMRFVLIGVVLLFALIGYIGFRNIKRSEQRSIWVGMAKETAHQLGTPLSSLSGWLELIKRELEESAGSDAQARLQYIDQQTDEMQKDMQRLNQIASRFSQIGSVPELKMEEIRAVLEETINYFKSRGPQFERCDIKAEYREVPLIPLNAELMSWVFENLFKNGMDAIGRKAGTIEIHLGTVTDKNAVRITFQDNGRGIEPEHINRVFEPGYSTKKRGWGLGLAFVKRIVEEYHNGKISIAQSVPGEGTTFEIILPVA